MKRLLDFVNGHADGHAGILRNISPIPAPSAASAIDMDREVVLPLLTPILTSVSLADSVEAVCELVSKEVRPFNLFRHLFLKVLRG